MWLWHRDGERRETEGMSPPPGRGWTLVPGQVPAGRVQDGTGPTKMRSKRAPSTRQGEYDSNGFGKVTSRAMKDDGRVLDNTLTVHG